MTTPTCCMRYITAMKTTWMRNFTPKCKRNSIILKTLRNHVHNRNLFKVDSAQLVMLRLSTQSSLCSSSKIKLTQTNTLHRRWLVTFQHLGDSSPTQSTIREFTILKTSLSAHSQQWPLEVSLKTELHPLLVQTLSEPIHSVDSMKTQCSSQRSSKERFQRYLSKSLMLLLCKMTST